jgi:hypothetical protein
MQRVKGVTIEPEKQVSGEAQDADETWVSHLILPWCPSKPPNSKVEREAGDGEGGERMRGLCVGATVQIHALVAKPEHNGVAGRTVDMYHVRTGRWGVRIVYGSGKICGHYSS